ncbi:MAG: NAD(P)H-hydrate epimerase, partial [Rhodospirillaceae bacterium]
MSSRASAPLAVFNTIAFIFVVSPYGAFAQDHFRGDRKSLCCAQHVKAALERHGVMDANAILSIEEMYRADALAVEAGISSLELMENAGQGIADAIQARWLPCPLIVLAGPGNNGGDGFVVARLLQEAGWPVKVALLGDVSNLKCDAAVNVGRWRGDVRPLGIDVLDGAELVIDALFGAGLARPLEGAAAEVIEAVDARWLTCVAADETSGVQGDSGRVMVTAAHAELTVCFFRPKPAHFLMPGRDYCGEVEVVAIGIPETVLEEIRPATQANDPALWGGRFPWPDALGHKYSRGHAVIAGGAAMTGAAQLAAGAARRTGAGLVTLAVPPAAFDIYASGQPGNLVRSVVDRHAFAKVVAEPR